MPDSKGGILRVMIRKNKGEMTVNAGETL